MKTLKIIIYISFFFTSLIYSQLGSVSDMPLAVGNKWIYKIKLSGSRPTSVYQTVSAITKDTIANGKQYFFCINFWGDSVNYFIRYNDSSKALVRYERNYCNGEIELLKLNPAPGDSNTNCYQYQYKYNGSIDTTLFGYTSALKIYSKYITNYYCIYNYIYRFFNNIGPYYKFNSSICRMGFISENTLIGAYINGIVYGDTNYNNTGSVTRRNLFHPGAFSLLQNYPNPFNPVTNITFDLPVNGFTRLVIYDQLGTEVDILVNEQLTPGSYKFEWNAADYPSGIYFYKLQAGVFVETKKMVLLK